MEITSRTSHSQSFDERFPILSRILSEQFANLTGLNEFKSREISKENYSAFKKSVKSNVFPLIQIELYSLIPEWQKLVDVKGAPVALHSLIVVYLIF